MRSTKDPLQHRFQTRLKSYQRKSLGREILHRMPESLLLGAAVIVPLFFLISLPWPATMGIALIAMVAAGLGPALRRYGSTARCAREFDRRAGTNTRVLNACELLQHGRSSEFARFAIADGCEALLSETADADAALHDPLTRRRRIFCAVILFVSGILCGLLLLPENKLGGGNATLRSHSRATEAAIRNRLRPLPPKQKGLQANGAANDATRSTGLRSLQSTEREFALQKENRNSGARRESTMLRSGTPEGETPQEPRDSPGEKAAEIGSSSHSSESTTATNPLPAAIRSSFAKSIGRGERSRRAGRKRSLRLNPEAAQGGAQPMLSDNAPPAGRELGEKEGDGDPDNGRSGPNGEKKSRGSAAMLPVIPQQDTVNGTLSPGAEIRSKESIPPTEAAENRKCPTSVATNGVEPLRTPEIMSLTVRKEIARFRRTEP